MYEISCREKAKRENLIPLKRYLFLKIRALSHPHWNFFGGNCESFWRCFSKERCTHEGFLHISVKKFKKFITNVFQ